MDADLPHPGTGRPGPAGPRCGSAPAATSRSGSHDWVETERNHRHVSHLYGLHPSNQITRRGTPAAARGRAPDPGAARRRRDRLVARLEDQLLGAAGGRRPRPQAHPRPGDDRTGSRRTCSTCTRRSRSTATSAPPPASPRCCCRATTASCTCCPRCRRPGRPGSVTGLRGRGGYTVGAAWSAAGSSSSSLPTAPAPSGFAAGSSPAASSCATRRVALRSRPTRLETDLIEFAGQAGHTYRASAVSAGPVEPGVNYRLVAQHSGKAADINGASTAAGRPADPVDARQRTQPAVRLSALRRRPLPDPGPAQRPGPADRQQQHRRRHHPAARHQRRQPAVAGRRPGRRGGQPRQPAERPGHGRVAGVHRRRRPHLPVDDHWKRQPAVPTPARVAHCDGLLRREFAAALPHMKGAVGEVSRFHRSEGRCWRSRCSSPPH